MRLLSDEAFRGFPMKTKQTGAFNAQAFLESAGIARKIVEYRRAEAISTQGDPCEHVLYIQKGGVKLSVLSKSGREAVVAMLGPGDFLGRRARCSARADNTATAVAPIRALVVPKDEMVRLLPEEAGFSDRFIEYMLYRKHPDRR